MNVSFTQHVNDFTNKANRLEKASIQIPEELLCIMLLNSLSREYENFNIAIESRDEIFSFITLKAKLKEEEARQGERDAKAGNDSGKSEALYSKERENRQRQTHIKATDKSTTHGKRFDSKCFNCGKIGHKAHECQFKKNNSKAYIG